jgi:hypothetical protein
VTVSFSCSDSLSGVASVDPPAVVSSEGANQSRTGSCTDKAGNSASATQTDINVDKTAPSVSASQSPAANANGWNKTDVTVSFSCSDSLSGVGSSPSDVTLSSEGANQSASGTCTDRAGNSASATKSGINIDKTAPTIVGSRTPSANANGWNNSDVTVSYLCDDALSGADTYTSPQTVSTEGANQSRTGSCADKAGNTASVTVPGISIDKTAPSVSASQSPAANANGWNNTSVTVSFNCTDSLSGVASSPADVTLSSEGSSQSASGTCTDKAGNAASATRSGINIDETAPSLSASRSPAANANGWNNTDVTVSFSCSDSLSGVDSGPLSVTVSTEGANQSASGTCTDKAGNIANTTQGGINVDKTAPSVSASRSPAANANGWNNSDVTVSFSCNDSLSGVDSLPPPVTVSSEGSNQSALGNCTDKAGNSAGVTQTDINIDKTAPSVSASRSPAANANGWNNTDVTVSFACSDSLSGVASLDPPAVVSSEGANQSRTGSCTDKAGNSASETQGGINIDKTAPNLTSSRSPAANANGWNKTDVTVSFSCSDSLSGVASSPSDMTLSGEGAGQSASGTCTDRAGNSANSTQSNINIDKTAPSVSASRTPAANANGWNNTDVTVSFSCNDSLSGVENVDSPVTVSSEGANQSRTGSCTDKAGNSAGATQSGINIDKTQPVIVGSRTPLANANGWNNTDVTVSYLCDDALSGADTYTSAQTVSTEGANQSRTGSCTDKAGNSASATVTSISIDKTAPTVTHSQLPAANANGWNNTDVTVSFACADGLSGVDSAPAQVSLTSEGAGQSASGTCTDEAGNSTTATRSGINIDKAAPSLSSSRSPAANPNGWNNSDVTVSFSCTDGLSGVGSAPSAVTVSTEGPNQSASGTCTDKAGNGANITQGGINIDKTNPTISAAQSPAANANGWNNTDVTVTFTCSDSVSGVDSSSPPVTLSSEGAGQSTSGTCTDKAGNSASATKSNINIDKTVPSVSASRSPAANVNGWNNSDVTVTFACADSLSGVASVDSPVTLGSEGAGQSASGNCTDKAGNSASATQGGINIDKTAPAGVATSLNRAPDHNGWYNASVPWTTTGSDPLSGIATCSSGTYSGPDGANQTVSGTCTDKAGNTSAPAASAPFKYDTTKPLLNPSVSPYPVVLNGSATANANATDATSGIDSTNTGCNPVVTSSPGPQTVPCHATDNAGNTNTANASYTVSYNFIGFLSPLNSDTSIVNIGNAGRTYPVKWQLTDANGVYVTNAVVGTTINVLKVSCTDINGASTDPIDYAASTGGTALRYDTTANQYIYNWATPSTKNSCYQLIVTPPSGIKHIALFKLQ